MSKPKPIEPLNKYMRTITCLSEHKKAEIDIYSIIEAYAVTCPARAHALKKLLMAGQRGSKDAITDLEEAILALHRAIELQKNREP